MIILQTHTSDQLDSLLQAKPHGILLSGPEGSGKLFAAQYLASRLLGLGDPEKILTYPYYKALTSDKNTIGIEDIRSLQKFLQLKTTGEAPIRRIVIIQDAHLMTIEAQNALLKSLEEPPSDTVIILTALETKHLKDTIYSRVQKVTILPVDKTTIFAHLSTQFDEIKLERAYLMSNGRVGLLHALLSDTEHKLATAILQVKTLLSSDVYARLLQVDELAKQKETIPDLIQAGKIIATTALEQAAHKSNTALVKKWHTILDVFTAAEASLQHNPNNKLLLTNIFLSM